MCNHLERFKNNFCHNCEPLALFEGFSIFSFFFKHLSDVDFPMSFPIFRGEFLVSHLWAEIWKSGGPQGVGCASLSLCTEQRGPCPGGPCPLSSRPKAAP